MFNSIYSDKLSQYYELRCGILSESAQKHELCYLKRFDNYLNEHILILSRLVDTFSSRILYPMLPFSVNHSIAVV